jgi:hypothetical protein
MKFSKKTNLAKKITLNNALQNISVAQRIQQIKPSS